MNEIPVLARESDATKKSRVIFFAMFAARLRCCTRARVSPKALRNFSVSMRLRSEHPFADHYKVLGVDPGTPFSEVKKAYNKVIVSLSLKTRLRELSHVRFVRRWATVKKNFANFARKPKSFIQMWILILLPKLSSKRSKKLTEYVSFFSLCSFIQTVVHYDADFVGGGQKPWTCPKKTEENVDTDRLGNFKRS